MSDPKRNGDDDPPPDTRGAKYRRAQQAGEPPPSDANPRGDTSKTTIGDRVSAFLKWLLPDDSDKDGDGRTGPLSTYTEWHALIIGAALVVSEFTTGNIQTAAQVIGIIAGGNWGRLSMKLPKKYRDQMKRELPHAIAGAVLAYLIIRFGPLVAGVV